MKIFAHRGYSAKYPENTLLAFEKAYEAGADGIELDVHFSRDHEIIVIHDESLSRTVEAVGFVRHHVLRDLKNYDLKGDYEGEDQHLITLGEYLDWAMDKELVTNIEIKNDRFRYPGLEQAVVDEIDARSIRDKVFLSSFRADSVALIKSNWPEIKCGWLIDEIRDTTFDKAREIRCDYIHPSKKLVSPEFVDKYRDAGMGINVYTVDSLELIEWMDELKVDGVFTNDVETAMQIKEGHHPRVNITPADLEEIDDRKLSAKERVLKGAKKRKGRGGGLLGIVAAMVISVLGSVLITKLLSGLLSNLSIFK